VETGAGVSIHLKFSLVSTGRIWSRRRNVQVSLLNPTQKQFVSQSKVTHIHAMCRSNEKNMVLTFCISIT